MAGQNILKAEVEAIKAEAQKPESESYDVYVNDYTNYGNWVDCSDYH